MKTLYFLTLIFFVAYKSHSQNCSALDNTRFFKSIQFGQPIPGDLLNTQEKDGRDAGYTNFRLQYDSLTFTNKKKYADFFSFFSTHFSFSEINENKKREIYLVRLFSFFEGNNQFDSSNYKVPAAISKVYDKLISRYGKPSGIEEATNSDSLFIKELGMPRLMYWNCNTITLQMRIRYGSNQKALNVMVIEIKDRRFEDIPEEVKLANVSNW